MVTIGRNHGKKAVITKTYDVTECPEEVDKTNWIGSHAVYDTFSDRFKITVADGKVSAERIGETGWVMKLKFTCKKCSGGGSGGGSSTGTPRQEFGLKLLPIRYRFAWQSA